MNREVRHQDRELIKESYLLATPVIMQKSKEYHKSFMYDPYAVFNWMEIFTHIEHQAWQEIRGYGVPLYPQYPIGRFFIDFANPYVKVGLECDGKDYHTYEKDLERDMELDEIGWKIYRVTGRECFVDSEVPEDREWDVPNEELCYWLHNTCAGIVYAIKRIHFGDISEEDKHSWLYQEMIEALNNHTYVK